MWKGAESGAGVGMFVWFRRLVLIDALCKAQTREWHCDGSPGFDEAASETVDADGPCPLSRSSALWL